MFANKKILIEGNSGFNLQVIQENNLFYVRKQSLNIKDSKRLERQAKKQTSALKKIDLDKVKIPLIESYNDKQDGFFHFDMKYVHSKDCITFLQASSKTQLDFFVDGIINLIEHLVKKSTFGYIDKEVFYLKLQQVYEDIEKDQFQEDIKKIHSLIKLYLKKVQTCCKIPIGFCHGDLTFSNILVGEVKEEIYLIDFLDCFLETPLQDMVKIRQDTYFFWSKFFYKQKIDQVRMSTILNYIDKKIDLHFMKYNFYKEYYKLFQIFNFFRLLPYAKNSKVKKFVLENLSTLLGAPHEFNNSSCR